MMDESQAISAFAALAQDTRLKILRSLVVVGPDGKASGVLAAELAVSPASMSFHLGQLETAGLVQQRRVSRSILYSARYDQLAALLKFMTEDCCAGDRRVLDCC